MGLFDFLKTKKHVPTSDMRFAEISEWLSKQKKTITDSKRKQTKKNITTIKKLLKNIEKQLNSLSLEEIDTSEPRLEKIISTNKPAYLTSMTRIIESIKKDCNEIEELPLFIKKLNDNIEAIGKANFGDGRYLVFSNPKQIEKIQGHSKELLLELEKIQSIEEKNDIESQIDSIHQKFSEYNNLIETKSENKNQKKELNLKKKNIDQELNTEIKKSKDLENKISDLGILKIQQGEKSIVKKIDDIEKDVKLKVSGLSRGLRKFGKISVGHSRLNNDLQKKPVEIILKKDLNELNGFFEEFSKAIENGSLDLKNPDKILITLNGLKTDIPEKYRAEYEILKTEKEELNTKLKQFKEPKQLKNSKNNIDKLKEDIKSINLKISGLENSIMALEKQIQETKEKITNLFTNLNIHLID